MNTKEDVAVISTMQQETTKVRSATSVSEISEANRKGVGRSSATRHVLKKPIDLSLNAIIQLPFVYWRLILCSTILTGLLSWGLILLWPRSYQSEAKLLILVGRESVALDPTVTTSQTMLLQKSQEEEINSALELLSSRAIADKVVENLGATAVIDGFLPSDSAEQPSTVKLMVNRGKQVARNILDFGLRATGLRDPLSDHELAVMKIQSSLEIVAAKKSSVITIHAESRSPAMAQAIAKQVMEIFMEQHLQVTRTKGSQQFFTGQREESDKRVKELLDRKSKFMSERNMVSVEASRSLLKDQIAALDRDLVVAVGELEQTTAEVSEMQSGQASLQKEIVASKLQASDSTWSGMRQRVYELELLEKSQSAIYTKEHPLLVKTREQLDGARGILEKLDSERMDESTTPNPVILQVEEQLQLKKAKIAGLESVITEKRKQKENFEKQIEELLDIEAEMTRIDSEVNVATNSLKQLAEKEEEARVIDELQANKISNVSVFQPASFVERAAKPNKPLLAAAGIVLGVLGGFGVAFLKEIGAKSLRSAEQVEQVLRQQVVGQIAHSNKNRVSLQFTGRLSEELYRDCGGILSRLLASPSSKWTESESCKTLGVIGVRPGCGASSIATALALTAHTSFGLKTILVDTDSGSSKTLSSQFKMVDKPSLENLIQGEITPADFLDSTTESGFSFVPLTCDSRSKDKQAGKERHHSWKQMAAAIAQFQHVSDIVIVDLSPATAHNQSVLLGCQLDGIVLVIESGETDSLEAERLLERLIHGKANVFGVMINKIKRAIPRWTENLLGIRV
ncbi:MAG: Tyrosine-protein kinase ptk [Planctomycetota bacterium]|jgi:uncharacterized protein involved in exopolysaccharide biosynthesis/MinD-like ATPase involved in chromosome partitioning or flagellar assembly